MYRTFIPIIALFLVLACGQTYRENVAMKKAAGLHREAIQIEKDLRSQLEDLIQQKNSINIQGRALTPDELEFVERVEKLESGFRHCEEMHIEVPGYGPENHQRSAAPAPRVGPQEMLRLQRAFRDSLVVLRQSLNSFKEELNRLPNL